jgi:V8-like Glu-specific endopeptidase
MVEIHEIWTATTIIIGTFNDRDINTATGFFFIDEEKTIYLITNKHVIYGDNYSDNPAPRINKIRLNLHTNVNDLKQNEWVNIDLFKNGQRIWLEHQNPVIDVILIPIALDRGKYVFLALDKTYLDSENALIYFEKIFVLGYPRGWYDYVNNLPITRIGNLSSPFKVPFLGINPYMIADVQTHPGMSGGPVLMDLQDFTVIKDGKLITYPGRRKFLLTGIYSGQCKIPGMDERPNLITIWFPELITDIIKANSSKK